jgi:hypothetical protein
MGRDVALDLVVAILSALALAPCVGGLVARLVGKQPTQETLGPPTTRALGRALGLRLALAHVRSVGGGAHHLCPIGSPRAPVAQGIERRFPKPCVAGSNPAGGTQEMRSLRRGVRILCLHSGFWPWGSPLLGARSAQSLGENPAGALSSIPARAQRLPRVAQL